MDTILTLLKQLSSSLSPTDFLSVLLLLGLTVFTVVKIFLKLNKKTGILSNIFGGGGSPEVDKIKEDLNELTQTVASFGAHQGFLTNKITEMMELIRKTSEEDAERIRDHATEMIIFQKNMESQMASIQKEIDSITHQLKMHDLHNQNMGDTLKESLNKIHTSLAGLSSQLEKTDEFSRAFVPEFRSYHKELSKEINSLSKDVALVGHSVQTQINNTNAVKLR